MLTLPENNMAAASKLARRALYRANIRILQSTGPRDCPVWCILSKPYLNAIARGMYGREYPEMVVLKALDLLVSWRGEEAREVKAGLKALLVEAGQ